MESFNEYFKCERLAICENGDWFKYTETGKIVWISSPRYRWNGIPEVIKQEITKYNLKWDWFGNYFPQVF
jgi:hypothetical protein